MSGSSDRFGELDALLAAVCDQTAGPDDIQRIESLAGDYEGIKRVLDYLHIDGLLRWEHGSGVETSDDNFDAETQAEPAAARFDALTPPIIVQTPDMPPSPFFNPQSPFAVGMVSYAAALLIMCVALLGSWAYKINHYQSFVQNRQPPVLKPDVQIVGQITNSKNCVCATGQPQPYVGSATVLGRKYALSSGLLEITYASGAKVILEGPCAYTVDSDTGGHLALGKLTARVEKRRVTREERGMASAKPQAAKPQYIIPNHQSLFTVTTPTAVVTDLGTEFGVEVDNDGNTFSYVFEGMVLVAPNGLSQTADAVQLGKGESIEVVKSPDSATVVVGEIKKRTKADFVRKIARFSKKYVYDFSRCEIGNIINTDGWHNGDNGHYTDTNFIEIRPNATEPMSGKYAYWNGDDYKGNIHVRRSNDANWSFSIPADKDWEISALVHVDSPQEGTTSYFGLNEHARGIDAPTAFGVGSRGAQGYNLQWRVAGVGHSARIGDEYRGICKVGMTADALGDNRYRVMLWYETTPGDMKTRRYFTTIPSVESDVTACNSILTLMQCRTAEAAPTLDDLTIRVD